MMRAMALTVGRRTTAGGEHMQISHDLAYDATPDEVATMLADPAFRERVCAAGTWSGRTSR